MALKDISDVDGRFISNANRKWWIYRIAMEFNINPQEVKTWGADEIMEALAAIGLAEKAAKKKSNSKPKKKGG